MAGHRRGDSKRARYQLSTPKAVLAGLLSITTTGLLSPVVPTHAMASGDASVRVGAKSLDSASSKRDWSGADSAELSPRAFVTDGASDESDGSVGQVDSGMTGAFGNESLSDDGNESADGEACADGDDYGTGNESHDGDGRDDGDDSQENADLDDVGDPHGSDGPHEDDAPGEGDPSEPEDPQPSAPEIMGEVSLGDVVLVSGADQCARAYASGRLNLRIRSEAPLAGVEVVCDGVRCDVTMTESDDVEGEWEVNALLPDGEYDLVSLCVRDESGATWDESFEHLLVDTVAPSVSVLYDGRESSQLELHGGKLYQLSRPKVVVEVTDESLEPSSVRVGGLALEDWQSSGHTYVFPLPDGLDLDKPQLVTGSDAAGNPIPDGTWVVPVVEDSTAPSIEAELLAPDVVASDDEGMSLFFAREASVQLHIADDCGLASLEVNQDGVCEVDDGDFALGDEEATLTLSLVEGCAFTGAVEVRAQDLAGNWCTWSIAEEGTSSEAGSAGPTTNAPVYRGKSSEPVYPLMLLFDATPPVVELHGVDDGAIYGESRQVRISVDEASFAYLQSYAGEDFREQVVLTLASGELDMGTVEHTPLLCVRDFELDELSQRWGATVELSQDGAYVLEVSLTDVAGNVSAPVACHFEIDTTAPICEVNYVQDELHAEEHEGAYYRTPRKAIVRIHERDWNAMQSVNLRFVGEDGLEHEIDSNAFGPVGDDWYERAVEFAEDGAYRLLVDATDAAGNDMQSYRPEWFFIDTKPPTIDVSFEGGTPAHGVFYGAPRTATVTIVEHNWGGDERYPVLVETTDGPRGRQTKASAWEVPDAGRPDVHVCHVTFDQDGRHTLTIGGRDLAGWPAHCGEEEGYETTFVIDLEAPVVEAALTPTSYAELDGIKYLNHPIEVPVSVRDRNLDAEATSLAWDGHELAGDAHIGWNVAPADETGEVIRSTIVSFGHGRHVSPSVSAHDLAGNVTKVVGEPFVVDLEAPSITSVSTTLEPVAFYEVVDGDARGEVQFFDQATQLVFEVSDEYLLEGVSLYDPDGAYRIESGVERGVSKSRVVVGLVEGAESHEADAYERNVVFTVADIAGNRHSWTLDRKGQLVADRVWEGADVTLNDAGKEPLALVQDSIAPVVAIEGITSGIVTNRTQRALVSVSEFNFSYLKAFRPEQVVVQVYTRAATPMREERVEEVRVSDFEGADPLWTFEREFATDGHYEISAQLTDVAGHVSNKVNLGEFTIDKTAPAITVTWDHDLDEANYYGGAHYFKTARRATVTVREHNFRATDVVVDAGESGVVGPWVTGADDTHSCQVDYAHEAKGCYLTVQAKDMAGNVARMYEQRDFVIDLTPPTACILDVEGPAGERAFAGDVTPRVEFFDGERGNFDVGVSGWSYELRGKRSQNVATRSDMRRFAQVETTSEDAASVTFEDFGTDAESGAYDVGFDDVYTLTAHVRDLAGNEGEPVSSTFSVNRFGSNFFVEDGWEGDTEGDRDEGSDAVRPLSSPPQIVVHEVNVSGALSEFDHSVVRDYANAPQELVQDAKEAQPGPNDAGYSLRVSSEASDYNDYDGWSEYVYIIRSGNFGEGAIEGSDGQGLYRVNVASVDAASNENSTSRYWASDTARSDAQDKRATVTFTLDELPPVIDDFDLGSGFVVGESFEATFHVTDDISCGDTVEALVDGKPQQVYVAGTNRPVGEEGITTGTYAVRVPARPFVERSVSVRVTDYDGREAMQGGSLVVSTLLPEVCLALLLVSMGAGACAVVLHRRRAAEPEYPHAV